MVANFYQQGELYYCDFPAPVKSRPVVILSRSELNTVRQNIVVALITRTIRKIPLEIKVGREEGLPKSGVISLGDIHTVPKRILSRKKGELSADKKNKLLAGIRLLFALNEIK